MPIGSSITPLFAQEVTMAKKIASLFGEELSDAMAEVVAAEVRNAARTAIFADCKFAACCVGYPFNIPVKIKKSISFLETFGNAIFDYYEKKYFG